MKRQDAIDALEKIYASMPTVECQGQCWNSCGGIDMTPLERERIAERGVQMPEGDQARAWSHRWQEGEALHCPALGKDRRCTVHEVRPLICRAWGVGRAELACTHGCTVTGRRLTFVDILQLQRQVSAVGGPVVGIEDYAWLDWLPEEPALERLIKRWAMGERGPLEDRLQEEIRAVVGRRR